MSHTFYPTITNNCNYMKFKINPIITNQQTFSVLRGRKVKDLNRSYISTLIKFLDCINYWLAVLYHLKVVTFIIICLCLPFIYLTYIYMYVIYYIYIYTNIYIYIYINRYTHMHTYFGFF